MFYFEDRLDALWNLCYWLPAVLLCSKIDWVHRFCHSTEELFLGSFWKSVANSMESQALFRVAVHFYGSMSQLEHEVTVSQGYLMPTKPTLHWKTIKRYLKFRIVPCQNKMVVKGSCWSQNKMWKDSKTGKQYLDDCTVLLHNNNVQIKKSNQKEIWSTSSDTSTYEVYIATSWQHFLITLGKSTADGY